MPTYNDPFEWFDAWFTEASQEVAIDPNAMTIATVDRDGNPSLRVVLLKSWDREGFVFYTNRRSRKGSELAQTGRVALNFFWRDLGRQIRIEGEAVEVDDAQSDAYFATRLRGSQIGAWASLQSQPLEKPDEFAKRVQRYEEEFPGEVPRPPHWGGYRVVPNRMEFWALGEFRMHERWVFEHADDAWSAVQLYP